MDLELSVSLCQIQLNLPAPVLFGRIGTVFYSRMGSPVVIQVLLTLASHAGIMLLQIRLCEENARAKRASKENPF